MTGTIKVIEDKLQQITIAYKQDSLTEHQVFVLCNKLDRLQEWLNEVRE